MHVKADFYTSKHRTCTCQPAKPPAKFSLRSRYAHSQQGEPVQNDLVASQDLHRRQIDIDM